MKVKTVREKLGNLYSVEIFQETTDGWELCAGYCFETEADAIVARALALITLQTVCKKLNIDINCIE